MSPTRIALYITSRSLTHQHLSAIVQTFDIGRPDSSLDPYPDYIRPRLPISPTSQPGNSSTNWALDLSIEAVWARHKSEYRAPEAGESAEWAENPIVIADERTLRDESVLVVDRVYDEEAENEVLGVRFEPADVPLTVANLEIANMDLSEVSTVIVGGARN